MIYRGMVLLGVTLPLLTMMKRGLGLMLPAIFMGVAQAIVFPSTVALVSTKVDAGNIGAGMGIIGTLDNAGKVAGPILGGLLIAWLDFNLTLWAMGALLLLGGPIIWFYMNAVHKLRRKEKTLPI